MHGLSCWGSQGGREGWRGLECLGAESAWARWKMERSNTLGLAQGWEGKDFTAAPGPQNALARH